MFRTLPMTGERFLDSRWLPVFMIAHAGLVAVLLALYAELEDVPALYLPAGILWAGLMLLSPRAGLVLATAAFGSQLAAELLVYRSPTIVALIYAASKTLEALVGVWLVRRIIRARVMSRRLYDVTAFVAVACIAMPVLFAVPPEIIREWALKPERSDLYFHWTILQSTGTALAAPLIVFWLHADAPKLGRRAPEAVSLCAFTLAVLAFVFLIEPQFLEFNSMLYLTFPPLIWSATRFGCRGAALSNFALATVAVGAALALGSETMSLPAWRLSVVELELFIGVTSVMMLLLGAYAEERERSLQMLNDHRNRLRDLSLRLVQNEENFRESLATQLHDDLGQLLAVTKIRLKLAEAATTVTESSASELSSVAKTLDRAIVETRRLTRETASTLQGDSRLGDAIQDHLDHLCADLPLVCDFTASGDGDLDPAISRVLSRCVRECIVNAIKHAGAARLSLALDVEEGVVRVTVADDGRGFDVGTLNRGGPRSTSFGLFSVENALSALGGTLDITSGARGTTVTLTSPTHASVSA